MFGGAHTSEEAQRQLRQCRQLLHKILMLAVGVMWLVFWLCISFASAGDSLAMWKFILAGTAFVGAITMLFVVITEKCHHLLWLFVGHVILLIVAIIVRYFFIPPERHGREDTPSGEAYGSLIGIVFLLPVIYMVVKYFIHLSNKAGERVRKPDAEESVAIAVD